MNVDRPRVLVCAYACEPNRGSEQGAGWNLLRALCAQARVTLVTRSNQVDTIQEASVAEGIEDLHVIGVEGLRWLRLFKRRTVVFHAFYYSWLLAARRACKELCATSAFDFGWHLTLSSLYTPSPLTGGAPTPFVVGPLGGGVDVAATDFRYLSRGARLLERTRHVRRQVGMSDPWVRRTLNRARVVFVHNEEAASRVRRLAPLGRVVLEQHAGCVPPAEPPPPPELRRCDFLFAGRHVEWKGLSLALHALEQVRAAGTPATMTITGTGPETATCKRLADDMGLMDAVVFTGWLSRDEMEAVYAESKILIHPALHDDSPLAVAEAMSFGVVPIVLDRGGPPLIVADAGVVVSDENRVRGLARAAGGLLNDPERLRAMSTSAMLRADESLQWNVRVGRMLNETLTALSSDSSRTGRRAGMSTWTRGGTTR